MVSEVPETITNLSYIGDLDFLDPLLVMASRIPPRFPHLVHAKPEIARVRFMKPLALGNAQWVLIYYLITLF
jgi:hypothetical protein